MDLSLRLNEPSYFGFPGFPAWIEASVSMHHPADQPIGFAVRQRPRVMRYPAIGNRGMQQRTYIAVKFRIERRYKIWYPPTHPRHAHRTDAFAPCVLVIRRHGINLIQQHLWRDVAAVRRKLRAAIAAEHAAAHDRGGQRYAGETGQQRGFVVLE